MYRDMKETQTGHFTHVNACFCYHFHANNSNGESDQTDHPLDLTSIIYDMTTMIKGDIHVLYNFIKYSSLQAQCQDTFLPRVVIL